MLKFIAAVGRHQDWTDAQWQRHYHDHHGPLVASTIGFTSQTLGYRQNSIRPLPFLGRLPVPERLNGITELWFEDLTAMQHAFTASDYLRDVRPDEGHFTDAEIAIIGMGREEVVRNGSNAEDDEWRTCLPLVHLFVFHLASEPLVVNVEARCHTRTILDPMAGLFPTARAFNAVDEYWFDRDVNAMACVKQILDMSRRPSMSESETPLLFLTRPRSVFDRRLLQT